MTGGDAWTLAFDGYAPDDEGLREALCTLGNGYFCTRGAGPETAADDVHYPGTYGAGVFNRLVSDVHGRDIVNEDLVNLPNGLGLSFRPADGDWLSPDAMEIRDYRQELDMRRGLLTRRFTCRDGAGRETRVETAQFVHMGAPHLAALRLRFRPENWDGDAVVRATLDGRVINTGVARYRTLNSRHLEALDGAADGAGLFLTSRISQSRTEIALAARTTIAVDGQAVTPARSTAADPGHVAEDLTVTLRSGQWVQADKVVALYTSRDRGISECGLAARQARDRAADFDDLLAGHEAAWAGLWRRADLDIGQDDHVQRVLRLHVFHLLQVASPHAVDLDAGLPARGLSGEAYRGHIFWDEVFILPYLTLRLPEAAKASLMYRYRRLDAARENARAESYRGAMYPWQSGSDGREETQVIHLNPKSQRWVPDRSHRQRHVNMAIAYNVWFYFRATGDRDFLTAAGAEMVLEIARFCASMARHNKDLDRYEIAGVMGPDEFHDGYPDVGEDDAGGLKNNAYTNVTVAWVLGRALEVLDLLDPVSRQGLTDRLSITPEETARWDEMSRKMRIIQDDAGIIQQFEGYADLKELDWDAYREKYGDIHRLDRILEAEGDDPNRYKLAKQADTLMLLYLFPAAELRALLARLDVAMDDATLAATIAYYRARTSEGSSLSRVVHAWILAEIDPARSWELFLEALNSDVGDIQGGTTVEGIHLGAMTGTADTIQRRYTGLELRDDGLYFDPALPATVPRLCLDLRYQGQALRLEVTNGRLTVASLDDGGASVGIGFDGVRHVLAPGKTLELRRGAARTGGA